TIQMVEAQPLQQDGAVGQIQLVCGSFLGHSLPRHQADCLKFVFDRIFCRMLSTFDATLSV
ncbi:hypothetical protein MM710_28735, partial [Klebsiella pneumoniae]|nr:hypothetical protein [Klebsiella pneumoniae]